MAKKVTILQHTGGELGNQLWNFASIYAYCLEKDLACNNNSFFEFYEFFPHLVTKNVFLKFLFFYPFVKYRGGRDKLFVKFFRLFYKIYLFFVHIFKKEKIITVNQTNDGDVFYLPPSEEPREISVMEKKDSFYFDEGIFRNPKGIAKHRNKIIGHFLPNEDIQNEVAEKLSTMRDKFDFIVGVHIRQGNYRNLKRGKFFVDPGHMRTFIDEFISKFKVDIAHTCFYISSDSDIEAKFFTGLNYKMNNGNIAVDMFTLAGADIIIGSDSHFGSFASY